MNSEYIAAGGLLVGCILITWAILRIAKLMHRREAGPQPTGEVHEGPEAPF